MDYVMVPVPEEHVVGVMVHVARLVARASVVPWTDEDVADVFDEVDEATRSLLALVARSTAAGKELSDDEAATTLELNVRELRSIVRDVGDAAQQRQHEPLMTLREVSVVLRNGRTVQRLVFTMAEPVARAIRAHERATLGEERSAPAGSTE